MTTFSTKMAQIRERFQEPAGVSAADVVMIVSPGGTKQERVDIGRIARAEEVSPKSIRVRASRGNPYPAAGE